MLIDSGLLSTMSGKEEGGRPTRLEGLLGLLDSGANLSVRRMAAKQIGELVAAHPSETRPVLRRVRRFLRSSTWDTRVAAGHAIAAIADHSPSFAPKIEAVVEAKNDGMQDDAAAGKTEPTAAVKSEITPVKVEAKAEDVLLSEGNLPKVVPASQGPSPGLTFGKLDVLRIMESGTMLFGSTGTEYQASGEDVAAQRARLRKDLGIDDRFSSGGDMLGLKDEDLKESVQESKPEVKTASVSELVDNMAGLSAREKNRLKREAKKRAKQNSDSGGGMPPLKRARTADGSSDPARSQGEVFSLSALATEKQSYDEVFETEFGVEWWEFQSTCELLKQDLLDPRWEMRHGAAVGLREVLKRHADSAGRFSQLRGAEENEWWLEDMCCRLVCVLAMDRFGDFVGDAVVAPVRETAAMIISACSKPMSSDSVKCLLRTLLRLLDVKDHSKWEVRHAGLLGLQYIIAVRQDMAAELLGLSMEPIMDGLQDHDDDVRAAAGEALIPVAESIVSLMPDKVPKLVAILWGSLPDLDDISAATGSILRLLARMTSIPVSEGFPKLWLDPALLCDEMSDDESEATGDAENGKKKNSFCTTLVDIVPRLWAFFRHSSKAVRKASIKLLHTLVSSLSDSDLALWLRPICGEALRRLFRNILLETDEEALQTSKDVWERIITVLAADAPEGVNSLVESSKSALPFWLEAASHESRADAAAYDQSQGVVVSASARRRRKQAAARRAAKAKKASGKIPQPQTDTDSGVLSEGPYDVVLMQHNVGDALGLLVNAWPRDNSFFESTLLEALQSPFAVKRKVACDVCRGWAFSQKESAVLPAAIHEALVKEIDLKGGCAVAEISVSAGALFSDSVALLDAVEAPPWKQLPNFEYLRTECKRGKQCAAKRDKVNAALYARTLHGQISSYVTGEVWGVWEAHVRNTNIPKRRAEMVNALRMRILSSLGFITVREDMFTTALAASAAGAVVAATGIDLPQKVGSLIKALMASIKCSQNPHVQDMAAFALAELAFRVSVRGAQKPLKLIIKNLTNHLTAIDEAMGTDQPETKPSTKKESNPGPIELTPINLAKRGASSAFHRFCDRFQENIFNRLPWLWETVSGGFSQGNPVDEDVIRKSLLVLQCIVGKLHSALHDAVASILPYVIQCAAAPSRLNARFASNCLADCVAALPGRGMQIVIHNLLPLLDGSQVSKEADRVVRQGAALSLRAVVDRLGTALIPYAAFLVVPMMKRMIDDDSVVRAAAAGVFGVLVGLIPLEGGAPDDPQMSESMSAERQEARKFLGQLLGTEPREHYTLPTTIGDGITLRKYQQECLDWLAFLNRYGLHGALCDDMGLGKTLMTLCIIAGDFVNMQARADGFLLPSLVVCPSTIVAHWVEEALRFFGHVLTSVVQYAGPPRNRARLRERTDFTKACLVVTSYDVLSNDLPHFENVKWNYVALDEGHVIKNPKTKVARAVRTLSPLHKLILTGTPIQNSVLELWAMFDFLMPGFLGSEASFKQMYGKPILASRDAKSTEADQQRGMVATEALHRQVLPFVLRRLKDDVLSELPPKIIQDYFCSMTKLQVELYEDFSQGAMSEGVVSTGSDAPAQQGHVFKALSYLRRLCSHPKLVLNPKHPHYTRISQDLAQQGRSVSDVESSAKLVGLRNILEECGIGANVAAKNSGGHRVLIFAQLKQMLDIVETDLFKAYMPSVTYMRLDGGVQASKRQSIVTRFNSDPTIDVLLLTTHVGGLGLNLTGADTVIFLEHDWNPTKDLQAMDRAHRMGQKRTVNVYRLITRGTLEEKIMGIQKFKTHIANTVVNRDNSSLQSMNTEQLVNLFRIDASEEEDGASSKKNASSTAGAGKGMKAALAGLDDLWEEQQYEDEFNVGTFLADIHQDNPAT